MSRNPFQRERLWTRRELADYARISTDTVDNLIRQRDVNIIRVGRSVRIPESEVVEKILRIRESPDPE